MNITFKPAPGDLEVVALFRADGLHINGVVTPWDSAPEVVEYGEQAGVSTGVDPSLGHTYTIIPSTWINPNSPSPEPQPEPDPMGAVLAWRAEAFASAWQIIAVLGNDRWQVIKEWAATQNFVTQTLIEKAQIIPRDSQMVAVLGWVLGMDDTEVDEVFIAAAGMVA